MSCPGRCRVNAAFPSWPKHRIYAADPVIEKKFVLRPADRSTLFTSLRWFGRAAIPGPDCQARSRCGDGSPLNKL